MDRKWIGALLLLVAAVLFWEFYINLPPPGLEHKGNGIVLFGVNLSDWVSFVGGIVSLISGVVTLANQRKSKKE